MNRILNKFLRPSKAKVVIEKDVPIILDIEGIAEPVILRRHKRARKVSLRLDQKNRQVILTTPNRFSLARAENFAYEHREWITEQLNKLPRSIPFAGGQVIPVLGKDYTLIHKGDRLRGLVERQGDNIIVPGAPEHIKRKLIKFLKEEMHHHVEIIAPIKASQIEKEINNITLRDQESRWGSCTTDGNLSFSWRLVFTPLDVLDYVVAHEVAHLAHMDHSQEFWETCDNLANDMDMARKWLKKNGHNLYQYG